MFASVAVAAAFALALGPSPLDAQTGTLTGTITATSTGQPVNGVQVTVQGTNFGSLTNIAGRYVVVGVPAGTYTLQALSVGYATESTETTITSGQTATADFTMTVAAVNLDEIVVTGTAGAVERRKLGTAVASLDVAAIAEAVPVTNFSQILEGRIPGVRSVGTVGGVGTTRVLKVRGTDSFSLGQRPMIYIDGVRVDTKGEEWGRSAGGSTTCCSFSGGAGEDRLSDLNPEEIDRVEVLKGPAASTLYGSEASGGVIQIFTKRGRSNSPANFTLSTSVGYNRHRPNFPTSLRSNFTGKDGTVAWDPNEKLIENGLINSYDLTVDGGGEEVTYFVSGGFSYEEGSIKPNDQKRGNLRVNLNWTASENMTIGVTSGYSRNRIYSLQSGNNWLGIYTNALLTNPLNATADEPYGGGLDVTVADGKAISTYSDTDRWMGSININWSPLSNFAHKATLGLDAVNDQKTRILPFGRHYTYIGKNGERNIGYRNTRVFTGDYLATLDYSLGDILSFFGDIGGSLAFGGQGYWNVESMSMATGKDYAGEGVTTVGGAARSFGGETFSEDINLGAFVQNRFDLTDDLFLTGAVRIDGNSAFGINYGFQVYPKADVAYNIPTASIPVVSSAKLRGAWGMAGKAPGAFASFQTYTPNTVLEDLAGVRPSNPGNDMLEPENKVEKEIGIDLGLFNDRVGIVSTYYHATTKNALLGIALPPSEGFSSSQQRNVGEILNHGFELAFNATALDLGFLRWQTGINYEWNENEIIDLGSTAYADSIPVYSSNMENGACNSAATCNVVDRWIMVQRLGGYREGYPIGAIFRRGVIGWDPATRGHVRTTYNPFWGQSYPGHMASLFNDFAIGNSLRLGVQVRGEWGASMVNSDRGYGVRQLAYDEYLQHLGSGGTTTAASDSTLNYHRLGYPVDSRDNIRVQEVTLTWSVPDGLLGGLGLQRTTISLSGYNLHWWDDCNCPDPNQQYRGGHDFSTSPFLGVPQPRRFLLAVRTRF
jgi:outer membrane receptor for ferrienterochelin and colicin